VLEVVLDVSLLANDFARSGDAESLRGATVSLLLWHFETS
jgi:hypothetical protein